MNVEQFIAKLKVYSPRAQLDFKNHGDLNSTAALEIICVLCRNLQKVPGWSTTVDFKDLLALSIECGRETQSLPESERVKALAGLYHIHRHAVRQNVPIPPETVLQISYLPYDNDAESLLAEYFKTYWNILADRITYIEKIKSNNITIIGLLPRLKEDVVKLIKIFDTEQFCKNALVFLIKKLHHLFYDLCPKNLNETFKAIFDGLSKKEDLKNLKKLPHKDVLDLYVKFNECFWIVIDNSAKLNFKDTVLYTAVRTCIYMFSHQPDVLHCLQNVYVNSFCNMLSENMNTNLIEKAISVVMTSCETAEKLGYEKAMLKTYPFISQILRLYLEFIVNNVNWKKSFTVETQQTFLKLMLLLIKKQKMTNQILKCENCNIKSGLHDDLRLSFSAKHFVSVSLKHELNITKILPIYYEIIKEQHRVLNDLRVLGCNNHDKCLNKAQTDIHNTAILLNQSKYFEYSIKIFDLYLKHEMEQGKTKMDFKNIVRALYNKSICELDYKHFNDSLNTAYLSFMFAPTDMLNSEKHISLVIDIKAKSMKHVPNDEDDSEIDNQELQSMTVLDSYNIALKSKDFAHLKLFLGNIKVVELLKQEFTIYVKLWPSVLPISGVWISLFKLYERKHVDAMSVENDKDILWTLYEVIIQTPTIARTIHHDDFARIVTKLLEIIDEGKIEDSLVKAVLLFLKAEYDIVEASQKYGWKTPTTLSKDVDQIEVYRTVPQEHSALMNAIKAVELLSNILPSLKKVKPPRHMWHALQIFQVFVPLLLLFSRPAHALQLAHICCEIAQLINDTETYVRNAGSILRHALKNSERLSLLSCLSFKRLAELLDAGNLETALIYLCDLAIYLTMHQRIGEAAKIVQYVQMRILSSLDHPEVNLDLATACLLDAQMHVCEDKRSVLACATARQSAFLTVTNNENRWSSHRLRSQMAKMHASRCSYELSALRSKLGLATAVPSAVPAIAAAFTHNSRTQAIIDNRLKPILGLPPSNESQFIVQENVIIRKPQEINNFESILDSKMLKRTHTSPSSPCVHSVPQFNMPDFMSHMDGCCCYACETPFCFVLACQTFGFEASLYFRDKETSIAKNYFEGVLNMFSCAEIKLEHAFTKYKKLGFESYIIDIAEEIYRLKFQYVQLDILVEAAFFEMSLESFGKSDDYLVRIHEIMEEISHVDAYLKTDVNNLMCTSARLRKVATAPDRIETGLESELENLKLSPVHAKNTEPPKTPEIKPDKPPKISNAIVNDEEIPNFKRKVIKFKLEDVDETVSTTSKLKSAKQTEFKIPITKNPVLEAITPRPSRSKPNILITQPSADKPAVKDIATPKTLDKSKTKDNEFFTPKEVATPTIEAETFFTPMTSVKTYQKKSLRRDIIKNLEKEFSTSTSEMSENKGHASVSEKNSLLPEPTSRSRHSKVETGAAKSLREKKTLKRSTSPGKLVETKPNPARSRRQLRIPINYSLDDEKK